VTERKGGIEGGGGGGGGGGQTEKICGAEKIAQAKNLKNLGWHFLIAFHIQ